MADTPLIRQLNVLEKPWAYIEASGHAPNGATVVQLDGPLDGVMLRQAVDLLQRSHTGLQVRIAFDRAGRPFLAPLETKGAAPSVPLMVLPRAGGDHAQAIVEHLLRTPFAPDEPLLRIVLLSPSEAGEPAELIISSQHCVLDLRSSIERVEALLNICQQIASGKMPKPPRAGTLPELREAMLPSCARGVRGRLEMARYAARHALGHLLYRPKRLVPVDRVEPSTLGTRVLLHELPASATPFLERRCRTENTRPLGACYAALLLSAARRTPTTRATRFFCETLVDARHDLGKHLAAEQSGCLVGSVATSHVVTPWTDFWTLAREVQADVVAAIRRGDHYHRSRLACLVLPAFLRAEKRVSSALAVSYVGKCGIEGDFTPFRVRSFWTAASIHGFGPHCFVTVLPRPDRWIWNISYVEPRLTRRWVEDFVQGAVTELLRALSIPRNWQA